MKYLLLLAILFLPLSTKALVYEARFDFSQGQPTVMTNSTATCSSASEIRFDFTMGQPTQVLDSTATCNAVVVAGVKDEGIIWFDSD